MAVAAAENAPMTVLHDLGLALWRLLPANPILVRVVTTGGKRVRHLWARLIYLSALFFVLIVASSSLGGSGSLVELAKKSSNAFMLVSFAQLILTSFIAPVFTAGAITQEKDANTFHILLTTPLSTAQIVLGSLVSRLYFVWVLLLSGLPIFCITMIYGGVTAAEVFLSLGLAASTGLVMGALAIAISVTRIGTRRTIFSFFVGVAVYMIGLWAIGFSAFGQLPEAPPGTLFGGNTTARMSWLAPVHPFMSLLVVTGQTPAPALSDVHHYGWPARWLLAYPHYGYVTLTTLVSLALVLYSLAFVRRAEKEGEPTWWNQLSAPFKRAAGVEDRRKPPRSVWSNPIAWREASTRASAGGRSALRWVMMAIAALAGLVMLVATESGWWGLTRSNGPELVAWLIRIELAAILLVCTNTAATTLTREKESLTIELLLSTPLTSRYIIAGMLRGLVSLVLPLIAVPVSTLLIFMLAALFRAELGEAAGWLEAAACVPLLMVAYASITAIVGLQMSLHSRKTVQAVMVSTGAVIMAASILTGCAYSIGRIGPQVAAFAHPFSPYWACSALVDARSLFDAGATASGADLAAVRVVTLIGSIAAAGLCFLFTFLQYRGMVRSFDMTVRRQSA